MATLNSRNQAIIKTDGDLTQIHVPLKGKLKSLETLESFSGSPSPLISKKFQINALTSGGNPFAEANKLMSSEFVAQGLYLDILKMRPEQINIQQKMKGMELKLRGNYLDHQSQEDVIQDFMYNWLRTSKTPTLLNQKTPNPKNF